MGSGSTSSVSDRETPSLCVTAFKLNLHSSIVSIFNAKSAPRVVQTAPLDQPCCQNHSTGSGGEERTSGLRPETLTTRLMASSPLTCLRDGRGNRAVGASQSVAAEVPIISQSNFSAGKGIRGSSRNLEGCRRQRHKT